MFSTASHLMCLSKCDILCLFCLVSISMSNLDLNSIRQSLYPDSFIYLWSWQHILHSNIFATLLLSCFHSHSQTHHVHTSLSYTVTQQTFKNILPFFLSLLQTLLHCHFQLSQSCLLYYSFPKPFSFPFKAAFFFFNSENHMQNIFFLVHQILYSQFFNQSHCLYSFLIKCHSTLFFMLIHTLQCTYICLFFFPDSLCLLFCLWCNWNFFILYFYFNE